MTDITRHLSALDLDALALGALPEGEARAARAHLATCATCRVDADASAALRDQFERSALARNVPTRPRRNPFWLVAPALAAAAAVALVFVTTRQHPREQPELAIKGDAAWQVVANRNGETFAVHDGASLIPGDRIRFAVTPNGAHFLLVASIDGAGTPSIYYPYEGSESAAVTGERVEVPGSIVLDAAPGPERLFALLSDEPITTAAVRSELAAIGADADKIRAPRELHLPTRAQLSLVFEKTGP